MFRALSPSETVYIRLRTFVVYGVLADGEIDVAALRRAFVALREAHPLLACIVKQDVLTAGAANEIVVVSEGEPDPSAMPGLSLDQSTALSGLEVVRSGRRARVDLHVHHCIADASHGLALLEELWSRYTDVVTTGDTKVEVQAIPPSFEQLLAARGVRKGERTGLEWLAPPPSPEGVRPPAPPAPVQNELTMSAGRLRLGKETTAALVQLARSKGTRINDLASAAILAAVSGFHPNAPTCTDATPTALPYIDAIDVRPWLTPPVGPTEGTTLMGLATYLGLFGPSTSLCDVALGITHRLNAELAEGVIQQAVLHESFTNPPESTAPPTEVVAVYATNWGIVPDLRVPDGLVLTDFSGAFFPPAATHAGVPMFLSFLFQGQLTVQAMFVATRPGLPTAQRILDAIEARIDGLLG